MKTPFTILEDPKKDIDEAWSKNPRYIGKELFDTQFGFTTRVDIGFKRMMGTLAMRMQIYWFHVVNDFDIVSTDPVLKESTPSVELDTRLFLIQKYGDRYYEPLKRHMQEKDPENYEYNLETIERCLKARRESAAAYNPQEAE